MDSPETETLWSKLRTICHFCFFVHAGENSHTGWSGQAEGAVNVSTPAQDSLIFKETGILTQGKERKIDISNTYQWTKADKSITLSHLRLTSPVELVTFTPISADGLHWHAHTPHLCGEDTYAASLHEANKRLILEWTIRGTRKDERIKVIYSD